jgi:hypothetical protein
MFFRENICKPREAAQLLTHNLAGHALRKLARAVRLFLGPDFNVPLNFLTRSMSAIVQSRIGLWPTSDFLRGGRVNSPLLPAPPGYAWKASCSPVGAFRQEHDTFLPKMLNRPPAASLPYPAD